MGPLRTQGQAGAVAVRGTRPAGVPRPPGPLSPQRAPLPVGQGRVLLQGLGGKRWQLLQVAPHHFIAAREGEAEREPRKSLACRAGRPSVPRPETPRLFPSDEMCGDGGVLPFIYLSRAQSSRSLRLLEPVCGAAPTRPPSAWIGAHSSLHHGGRCWGAPHAPPHRGLTDVPLLGARRQFAWLGFGHMLETVFQKMTDKYRFWRGLETGGGGGGPGTRNSPSHRLARPQVPKAL